MRLLKIIAQTMTFLGLGWVVIAAIGFWVAPLLFGISCFSTDMSINGGVLMFVVFLLLMLTGMVFWFLLEKKKK